MRVLAFLNVASMIPTKNVGRDLFEALVNLKPAAFYYVHHA